MPPEEPVRVPVSEQEHIATFAAPAVYTNRFFVVTMGNLARIAFAEQEPITGSLTVRTAVLMQLQDMIHLGRLLTEMSEPAIQTSETSEAPNDTAQL